MTAQRKPELRTHWLRFFQSNRTIEISSGE